MDESHVHKERVMENSTATQIKNLLLIGAGFRNKGAEAMAMTAARRFSRMYRGCRVTVASYFKKESRPYGAYDVAPLSAEEEPLRFELIKNTKKLSHPVKILLWRLFPFPQIRQVLIRGDLYLERFARADLVVDISGFGMTDQRSLVRRIVYCFEIFTSLCFGVPFISFTQAMGPFRKPLTRIGAKLFLPHVALLVARDQSTARYLKEIGIERKIPVHICSDSALLFEPTPEEVEAGKKLLGDALEQEKPLFGIVPNIMIFHRLSPQNELNPYIRMLARLCEYIQENLGARAVFICHAAQEYQLDDEWLMREVLQQVNQPDDILRIGGHQTAGELKAVIGQLDFIVASRYHSLVAAVSTATPFLALGWAHKYDELANDAGVGENALSFQGLSEDTLLRSVESAWNQREEIRKRLEDVHDRLRESAEQAFRLVAEKWPGREG